MGVTLQDSSSEGKSGPGDAAGGAAGGTRSRGGTGAAAAPESKAGRRARPGTGGGQATAAKRSRVEPQAALPSKRQVLLDFQRLQGASGRIPYLKWNTFAACVVTGVRSCRASFANIRLRSQFWMF